MTTLVFPRGAGRRTNGACERAADLIAALMWGPQSYEALSEVTGVTEHAVARMLREFRRAGVVVKAGRLPPRSPRASRGPQLWALADKPFGEPRAPA